MWRTRIAAILTLMAAAGLPACTRHQVEIAPVKTEHLVEVKPMEMTININVNVRVDRALEDFFGDIDGIQAPEKPDASGGEKTGTAKP